MFNNGDNVDFDTIDHTGSPVTQLPGLDDDLWNFLKSCWRDNPDERPPMNIAVCIMEMFWNRSSAPEIAQASDLDDSTGSKFKSESIALVPEMESGQTGSQAPISASDLSSNKADGKVTVETATSTAYFMFVCWDFIKKYAFSFSYLIVFLVGICISRWM